MTDSPCILYAGYITPRGYGQRGHVLVHREALAQKLGRPVRQGYDACHTCDVRACINPDHLYEGTRQQNMRDCTARGRHNKPTGEKHWVAKFTDKQVVEMVALSDQGWTRKAIAEVFHADASWVSRIVRGKARLTRRTQPAPLDEDTARELQALVTH